MSILGRALFSVEHVLGLPKTCYTANPPSKANPAHAVTIIVNTPVEPSGFNWTLEGDEYWNTAKEQAKIPLIEAAMNKYLWSNDFENFILNPANGLDINQLEGLTPAQALNKLRSEKIHMVLRFYYDRWTTTVGYRNPGENIVYCNRKYHDYYSIKDEASNLSHEGAHIINVTAPLCGFQHDYQDTPRRPFSMNYRINAAYDASKDT